jgi:hypothetical protein
LSAFCARKSHFQRANFVSLTVRHFEMSVLFTPARMAAAEKGGAALADLASVSLQEMPHFFQTPPLGQSLTPLPSSSAVYFPLPHDLAPNPFHGRNGVQLIAGEEGIVYTNEWITESWPQNFGRQ